MIQFLPGLLSHDRSPDVLASIDPMMDTTSSMTMLSIFEYTVVLGTSTYVRVSMDSINILLLLVPRS